MREKKWMIRAAALAGCMAVCIVWGAFPVGLSDGADRGTAEEKETTASYRSPTSGGTVSNGSWEATVTNTDEKSSAGKEDGRESGTADTNCQLPKLKVNTASGLPGNEVQLKVSVEDNPGILGMILSVGYDESVLQLKSVENGEAVADVLTLTASKTLASGAKFVWDGLELAPENIKDGTVLLMNFKIADTADEGKYSINFGYAEGDIIDNAFGSIFPQMEQGCITVEAKEK